MGLFDSLFGESETRRNRKGSKFRSATVGRVIIEGCLLLFAVSFCLFVMVLFIIKV